MEQREATIRLWFDMWLKKADLGMAGIFSDDVVYIESWGPQYEGRAAVRHWFREWNARGKVLVWEIKGYFHREDRTVVEWYFRNQMNDGRVELDGTPAEVFRQVTRLRRLGLTVPDTVDLLDRLRREGLEVPLDALSVEDCAAAIAETVRS